MTILLRRKWFFLIAFSEITLIGLYITSWYYLGSGVRDGVIYWLVFFFDSIYCLLPFIFLGLFFLLQVILFNGKDPISTPWQMKVAILLFGFGLFMMCSALSTYRWFGIQQMNSLWVGDHLYNLSIVPTGRWEADPYAFNIFDCKHFELHCRLIANFPPRYGWGYRYHGILEFDSQKNTIFVIEEGRIIYEFLLYE